MIASFLIIWKLLNAQKSMHMVPETEKYVCTIWVSQSYFYESGLDAPFTGDVMITTTLFKTNVHTWLYNTSKHFV